MTFCFGVLIGFIAGLVFTVWNDRQRWNACPKGSFHFWDDYMQPDGIGETGSRYCSKCGVDQEANWWGQKKA